MYFLSTGVKISLSEQQIVDCNSANQGCNGGLMKNVYEYAKQNTWETESAYPYRGAEKDCHHKSQSGYKILRGYTDAEGYSGMVAML